MYPIKFHYKILSKGDIIFATFACVATYGVLWIIGLFYFISPDLYIPILGIIGLIVLMVRVTYRLHSPIALEIANNQACIYYSLFRKQTIEFSDLLSISFNVTSRYDMAYIGLIIRNGQEHKYPSALRWGRDETGNTIKVIKIPVHAFKGQPKAIYEELRKASGLPEDNTRADAYNAHVESMNKKLNSDITW